MPRVRGVAGALLAQAKNGSVFIVRLPMAAGSDPDRVHGASAPLPCVLRPSSMRRRLIGKALMLAGATVPISGKATDTRTVFTFGDSILDCGHYNEHGVDPGQLIVSNHDRMFPEFRGRDLQSRGPARLVHRAVDGATVAGLDVQLRSLPGDIQGSPSDTEQVALLTVGGNDLLRGLAADRGQGMLAFEKTLESFLSRLPIRPVLIGTVYDPTFGNDARNFLGVEARLARGNHRRINDILRQAADRYGRLADVHRHFLGGDPSWYTHVIEPSLTGASEVRRVFLEAIERG